MTALPTDVEVRALLPEGVRYILPRRTEGALPGMGQKTLAVGLIIAAVGLSLVGAGIWQAVGEPWDVWAFNPLTWFGIALIVVGCFLAGIGILIAYGHAEILLDRDFVIARERAGLVRWTWRQPLPLVKTLEVKTALVNPRQEKSRTLFRIQAGDIFLAPGFPREFCVAIANDLLARWPSEGSEGSPNPRPNYLLTVPEPLVPPPAVERTERPHNCRVLVDDSRDAVSLNVPAAGIWKVSKGLLGFSLAWNGIIIFVAAFWSVAAQSRHKSVPVLVWLLLGFLAIIGVAVFLGAINMGRRKAAIAATNEQMMVVQQGPLGTKRQQWNRQEIVTVVVGPSGMVVNNVPVPELQVYSTDGIFGVLAGHPTEELEWMATLLRQRLNIVPHTADSAPTT